MGKITGLLIVLLFSVFSTGCSQEGKAKNNSQDPKANSTSARLTVKVAPVEVREVQRMAEMVGTLLPYDEITIGTEFPGTIEKIFVDMGDKVEGGQLLALLDQRETRLALEQAEANLEAAKRDLEKAMAVLAEASLNLKRVEELFSKGIVAASQRDSVETQHHIAVAQVNLARATVKQSQAAVNLAKKRLGDTEIKAPIAGAIKERLASIGETVKEKTPLFRLVTTDPLKFRGTVPERFAPEVAVGQEVKVQVEAFQDQSFLGRIERVSPAVDIDTRSLTLEVRVPNPEEILKPGFFTKGIIFTRRQSGVTFVPENALLYFVGITKVFVVSNGEAVERLVKTGVTQDGMVEIIDGIKPGELVATSSLDQLFNGARVRVEEDAEKNI